MKIKKIMKHTWQNPVSLSPPAHIISDVTCVPPHSFLHLFRSTTATLASRRHGLEGPFVSWAPHPATLQIVLGLMSLSFSGRRIHCTSLVHSTSVSSCSRNRAIRFLAQHTEFYSKQISAREARSSNNWKCGTLQLTVTLRANPWQPALWELGR